MYNIYIYSSIYIYVYTWLMYHSQTSQIISPSEVQWARHAVTVTWYDRRLRRHRLLQLGLYPPARRCTTRLENAAWHDWRSNSVGGYDLLNVLPKHSLLVKWGYIVVLFKRKQREFWVLTFCATWFSCNGTCPMLESFHMDQVGINGL